MTGSQCSNYIDRILPQFYGVLTVIHAAEITERR